MSERTYRTITCDLCGTSEDFPYKYGRNMWHHVIPVLLSDDGEESIREVGIDLCPECLDKVTALSATKTADDDIIDVKMREEAENA